MGSIITIREMRQDFMPLNFPVEYINLIVQLLVLFNAYKKTGSCHRRIPLSRATSCLRIPAKDVPRYALVHPESSVRDINKTFPTQNRLCGTYYIRKVHILIIQSWRRN
ncbi:uncharacterized protein TNCV_3666231 [Trichonephila clavipes]|uniref:Uncharacterized protein n=1 Tax=Trichonephila clavipes TaxID=2585209 RepID=A0A8X6VDA7_TRICX|nr:uncharacterized protein TNCV_3666231 [Trichonephila clavipes]